MVLIVPIPNFSVVLPGGCNASCPFCTWTISKAHPDWLTRLSDIVRRLPPFFVSVSVTGGEPLLSPFLDGALDAINVRPWDRRVLTTNGTTLEETWPLLTHRLDYLNISRHHDDDVKNQHIFGNAKSVPDAATLARAIAARPNGIQVSLNCVVSDLPPSEEAIERFVCFARGLGTQSATFRKIQTKDSTVEVFDHERLYLKHPTYKNYPCPVCRTASTTILGFPVKWKSAVLEPSQQLGYWFEAILHPNGTFSGDWAATMVGEPEMLALNPEDDMTEEQVRAIVQQVLRESGVLKKATTTRTRNAKKPAAMRPHSSPDERPSGSCYPISGHC